MYWATGDVDYSMPSQENANGVFVQLAFLENVLSAFHGERPLGFEGLEKTFSFLTKTVFYAKKAY